MSDFLQKHSVMLIILVVPIMLATFHTCAAIRSVPLEYGNEIVVEEFLNDGGKLCYIFKEDSQIIDVDCEY